MIDGLEGKFGGMAFRVPTSTVSVVDFTVILNKPADKDSIRKAMLKHANDSMKGILSVTDELLVAVPALVSAMAFLLLYKLVPHRPVRWRDAISGAVVACLLFEGAKQGFSVFYWLMNQVPIPGVVKALLYIGIVIANFLCALAGLTSTCVTMAPGTMPQRTAVSHSAVTA